MSELPLKLDVQQQLLVSAVADTLSETTSIHQQAVLRMLAMAEEHNLNAANVLQDLGVEMRSKTGRQIPFVVEDLQSGLPAIEALARSPGVVPEPALIAMEIARSRGLQKPLNQALLTTTNRRKSENTGVEAFEAVDRTFKLMFKYMFVFWIFSFLMLFVIPQFKMMFEEFGMELPSSMYWLIEFSNQVSMYWFVFVLFLIVLGGYLIYRHPRIFTSYFDRWIPNRWQQPVLTQRAKRDLSLAWVVQASEDLPRIATRMLNESGIGLEDPDRSDDAKQTESTTGLIDELSSKRVLSKQGSAVVSTASSRESAGWILRKMSKTNQSDRRRRSLAGLNTLIWIGNIAVMGLAAWAAIAIINSLLIIIWGLTNYV